MLLPLLLVCVVAGCDQRHDTPKTVQLPGFADPADHSHPPVERDLKEVQTEGVLRIAVTPGPLTYMVFRGGEAGFEFELMDQFCREWNLRLDPVLLAPGEGPFRLLDEGLVDVVCTGLVADNELKLRGRLTQSFEQTRLHLALPGEATADTVPDALTATLTASSRAAPHLRRFAHDLGFEPKILRARPRLNEFDLLRMVATGEITATVAPASTIDAAMARYRNLHVGPAVAPPSHRTWAVRSNAPELQRVLDRFLSRNYGRGPAGSRRSRTYGIIRERYIGDPKQVRYYSQDRFRPDRSGVLTPWDHLLRRECDRHGVDWLTAAALMYEESTFDPSVVSSAGAVGLMQVLPRFSRADSAGLLEPEINIAEGVRYLAEIRDFYDYLPDVDRELFTLATYHAGYGHMADARRIAMDAGLDPNRWYGNVAIGLARKRDRVHHTQSRHGYYRGDMSVDYAESILRRREVYRVMLERYEDTVD